MDDCFWKHQNINCHKVPVLELIISKGYTQQERGERSKLFLCIYIYIYIHIFILQNVPWLFHDRCPYHMICRANQWTGFYMIATFVMKELRYIKMITWFLFPNILTQGNLFVLFRKSCRSKLNTFFYIGMFLREGIFAKNWEDLWKFFLEDWYKWISLSFASRTQLLEYTPMT